MEGGPESHLRHVLEELSVSCTKYVQLNKSTSNGPGIGRTKLDKERMKLCQREIVSIMQINILFNTKKNIFRII